MEKEIEKAIEILKNGGIVIFPTDTAIGIGCRIDNQKAVEELFKIRKRPKTKAVPVLFSSIDMVRKYVKEIPQDAEKLMQKYWPGALTLILYCNKVKVPSLVRGGGQTLGVRIPNNKIIKTIIAQVGMPILGPSANFSGEKTPFTFGELNPKLVSLADYVLNVKVNSESNVSTIIDCTIEPWKIIREGAVKVQSSKFKVQSCVLLIDTADSKQITVGLRIDGQKYINTKEIKSNKTQVILPMIDEILKKHSLKPEDICEIQINAGPGSFTGIRVGLAIANTLSFVLKIPINGKKVGQIILPIYK
ncbi:MAG: threonylcarbamoyl-AMP synthase [Candidatus Levybacteria bacterium]|nr:threonylcarbamoyl-AMP synthase [Candidatus Levybacteria bacterium]